MGQEGHSQREGRVAEKVAAAERPKLGGGRFSHLGAPESR